jgi:hypothetical protein
VTAPPKKKPSEAQILAGAREIMKAHLTILREIEDDIRSRPQPRDPLAEMGAFLIGLNPAKMAAEGIRKMFIPMHPRAKKRLEQMARAIDAKVQELEKLIKEGGAN